MWTHVEHVWSVGITARVARAGRGSGGKLRLEMGPDAPTLFLVSESADGAEVWPMKWMASRSGTPDGAVPGDVVYVLELPTPTWPRLLVRAQGWLG